MTLLITWLTVTLGLWASHSLIKGFRIEGGAGSFLLLGAVVGILYFILGWFLFVLLGIATLGVGFLLSFLTKLIVTAIVLKFADGLSRRFTIDGFLPAFMAACIMSLVSLGMDYVMRSI
jgi:uncharacterized membrane protein YvlD (DUF360 family)